MQVRFGTEVEYIAQKYTGVSDPTDHIAVQKHMGIDTKEGMDAQVYTYIGYNS
jgi:hypothetical protein